MGERTGEPADGSRRSPRRPTLEVLALAVVLAAIAAALLATTPDRLESTASAPSWATPAISLVFAATLFTVVRIEFRDNAVLLSLSEVPLIFAALYLAPLEGLAGRVLASALVYALIKRIAFQKIVFNLASFAAEIAGVYLIVRLVLPAEPTLGVQTVLVVTGATAVVGVLGSIFVALAVSRYTGNTLDHVVDELKGSWVFIVNAAMGGALLSLFLVSPALAVLSIVPVSAIWLIVKRHGALAQQLRDLNAIHGYAGRVGRSLVLDDIGQAAVSEAAALLRADMSMLILDDSDGAASVYTTDSFPAAPVRRPDVDWADVVETGSALVTTGAKLEASGLRGWDRCGDVTVASVDDEIGRIGVLIVARTTRSDAHFVDDDARRMQNLADQLASSLRKGMLYRRIEHEAAHDALTGLPNRLSLQRHLVTAAERAPLDHRTYVFMLDLDRFKEVNDTLGHHAGDELLIEFSRRMSGELGPDAFFSRLAGDEFAAVVHAVDDDAAMVLAQRCIAAGAAPLTLDGLSIVITASIGIATLPRDLEEPEVALRQADIAMYNSKARRLGAEMFRSEHDRRTPARLSMLGDLRHALDEEHLDLEFQPKLDLASGLVIGAEALVRWTHDVRGVVAPSEFVRVAEDTGLIKQLTDMMLTQGIREIRALHDRGHHLSLSVNLSTHDLLDANLSSRVAGYLADHGVDPASLTLEITESSLLVEAPRSLATIHELHDLGVRMSIDDFGTGYSSLSYLRQLPVSELKVDRSFIATMLVDSQDEVIVRSTVDLGHNLGLEVVAEGVENEQILDQLRSIGCDVAQGYTISRPLSPTRFLAWLHTSNYSSRRVDPTRPEAWTLGNGS